MIIRKTPQIKPSEITPEGAYLNRRQFIKTAGITTAGIISSGPALAALTEDNASSGRELENVSESLFSTDQPPNSWRDITTYNNFYEFGTAKSDPAENAGNFVTTPWKVKVSGQCNKPGEYNLEDIIKWEPAALISWVLSSLISMLTYFEVFQITGAYFLDSFLDIH